MLTAATTSPTMIADRRRGRAQPDFELLVVERVAAAAHGGELVAQCAAA